MEWRILSAIDILVIKGSITGGKPHIGFTRRHIRNYSCKTLVCCRFTANAII